MNCVSVSFLIREILNTDCHSANGVNEHTTAGMLRFKRMVVITCFSEHIYNNVLNFSLNFKLLLMGSYTGSKY